MSPASSASHRLLGIGLMVATGLFFASLDTTAKWLVREVPAMQVVWLRYAASFGLLLPFVNPWRTPAILRPRSPARQVFRGFLVLGSTVFNFLALQYLQLAQTISINFSTPLLVALMAGPILGEWVGWKRGLAIAAGFAGVVVVAQPGLGGFHWAMGLSLAGAVVSALGNVFARMLVREDGPFVPLFYLSGIGTLATLPLMPFIWVWPTTPGEWALMLSMGIGGLGGHYCLVMAHHYAPASVVAPFIYTQLIWMVLSGWLIFGDVPDHATLAGAAIVIASGLYLLWRERVRLGEVRSAASLGEPL